MTFVIQVKLNSSKFSAMGVTATKKQSLASIVEISTIDENLFNWTLEILCWGERKFASFSMRKSHKMINDS